MLEPQSGLIASLPTSLHHHDETSLLGPTVSTQRQRRRRVSKGILQTTPSSRTCEHDTVADGDLSSTLVLSRQRYQRQKVKGDDRVSFSSAAALSAYEQNGAARGGLKLEVSRAAILTWVREGLRDDTKQWLR